MNEVKEHYKTINLSRGLTAIVSPEDYQALSQWKWHSIVTSNKKGFYAGRNVRRNGIMTILRMHQAIIKTKDGQEIDHIDGNGLNNHRSNLRVATRSQNMANVMQCGVSGYKGVSWKNDIQKWRARIKLDGKSIYLGAFTDKVEAAKVYDAKAFELFGEFAYLNFPKLSYER